MVRASILAAALLCFTPAPALAQTVPPPLSERGVAALDQFRRELAESRRRISAAGPSESVAGELARRVALEQAGRSALHTIRELPDAAERRQVSSLAWAELRPIDQANVAYLKSVLPQDGWFRHSRDGRVTAANAWLIAQHATDDPAFMQEVLTRMAPLARKGEVSGQHYAMLYDRVTLERGGRQRYGSQARCSPTTKVWEFRDLEDPARVDHHRRTVGYPERFADTGRSLRIGQPC